MGDKIPSEEREEEINAANLLLLFPLTVNMSMYELPRPM